MQLCTRRSSTAGNKLCGLPSPVCLRPGTLCVGRCFWAPQARPAGCQSCIRGRQTGAGCCMVRRGSLCRELRGPQAATYRACRLCVCMAGPALPFAARRGRCIDGVRQHAGGRARALTAPLCRAHLRHGQSTWKRWRQSYAVASYSSSSSSSIGSIPGRHTCVCACMATAGPGMAMLQPHAIRWLATGDKHWMRHHMRQHA